VAQASQALGTAMYAQAQQEGMASPDGAGPEGAADGAEDDVVDAEIVDEGEAK
jgi:molecular chaperone DnaK